MDAYSELIRVFFKVRNSKRDKMKLYIFMAVMVVLAAHVNYALSLVVILLMTSQSHVVQAPTKVNSSGQIKLFVQESVSDGDSFVFKRINKKRLQQNTLDSLASASGFDDFY